MYDADNIENKSTKMFCCQTWVDMYSGDKRYSRPMEQAINYELRTTTVMGFWETRYLIGIRYFNDPQRLKECW